MKVDNYTSIKVDNNIAESEARAVENDSVISDGLASLVQEFQDHKDTDLVRWQDFYFLRAAVLDIQAGIQNKVLDTANTIDIETEAQSTGYTATNDLGGRINFSATSILISAGVVKVNDQIAWSSAGLSLSIGPITDSLDIQKADVVTCSGIESITYTPYISST